jgi:hypothetical protein
MGDPVVVLTPRPREADPAPLPTIDPDPVIPDNVPAGGAVILAPGAGTRFAPDPAPKPPAPVVDTFDPRAPLLLPRVTTTKITAPPPPPPGDPASDSWTSTTGPVTVHIWPKLGLLGATLAGQPWVTVRWPAPTGRESIAVEVINAESSPRSGIGLKVRVGAPIKVLVNREAEDKLAASAQTRLRFVHDYSAGGRPVEVNQELSGGRSRLSTGDRYIDARDEGQEQEFDLELGLPKPAAPAAASEPFAWRFETRAQLDAWAAAHPQLWWVEGPPDGAVLQAMHADEKRMRWLAGLWRTSEEGIDVRTVYEKGVPWESPDPLWDLFYVTEYAAQEGPPGDAGECLIFRHDGDSYGRVPLSHEQAQSAWLDLEAGGLTAPSLVSRVPRGTLAFVAARGNGTIVHRIGDDYLQRRTAFFAGLAAKRDLDALLRENGIWWGYLKIALDRESYRVDPALRTAFFYNPGLWSAAGTRALAEIEAEVTAEGIFAVQAAMDGIDIYRDEDAIKRLVLSMPGMTEKARHESITFLGFEGMDVCDIAHPLAKRENAALVWMGQTVGKANVEVMREKAAEQYEGLKKFRDDITYGRAEPFWDSGEFGRALRERVYKRRGFGLGDGSFPFEARPRAAAADEVAGSALSYAFQVGAGNEKSWRRTKRILLVVAVVVASVVLVLVANAAGALIAGLLITEGTIGFMVMEVLVASAIITAAGPAVNTFILSGGSADAAAYSAAYAHWGKDFVWNVVTFGVFKALGAGVRGLTLLAAGVKDAQQLGNAWKAAEVITRASASGLTMYGIAGIRARLEDKPMPQGEERTEMLLEMGLSLVLMEFAGFAVSKPMKGLQEIAREFRLGSDVAKNIDSMLVNGQILARKTALYAAEPGVAGRSGRTLLNEQIEFLRSAQELVKKLKSSRGTRADGERLAARLAPYEEMIAARLDLAADFAVMTSAKIRPASLAEGNREFTYERGKSAELEAYYKGKGGTVRVEGDTLFVTIDGKDLTLRPAVDGGIRPDGTRIPEALDAWRLEMARRRLALLADATDRASIDADVRKARDADPSRMDAKELAALDKVLTRAAARLAKVEPRQLGRVDKSGTDTAGWQARLADARQALLARAEVLGITNEPEIAMLRGRGRVIGRRNLADNTLARQQELVEAARKVVDKYAEPQRALGDAAASAAGADLEAVQTGLEARQADVRRRAEIYGIKDGTKYLEAVKKMRPGGRRSLEGLREAEAVLERAEARIDALARRALTDAEATHGKAAVDAVRADPEFALLTDAQVGDALRAFGGSRNPKGFVFSPEALRGALWATVPEGPGSTRSGITFDNVRGYAGGPEEITFALEAYGRMRDLGIEGSFALMRRAVSSPGSWKGGVWQMEVARDVFGLENIKAFEFAGGGREVDILLKNGKRIECKDWAPSTWEAPKVRKQMTADLEGATGGGKRPDGIKDILWLFRAPPPRSPATIRATLRDAFTAWLAEKGTSLTPDQIDALKTAFDAHLDLVQVPDISRTGVTRPPPQRTSGVPPRPRDDDDKTKPPIGVLVAP